MYDTLGKNQTQDKACLQYQLLNPYSILYNEAVTIYKCTWSQVASLKQQLWNSHFRKLVDFKKKANNNLCWLRGWEKHKSKHRSPSDKIICLLSSRMQAGDTLLSVHQARAAKHPRLFTSKIPFFSTPFLISKPQLNSKNLFCLTSFYTNTKFTAIMQQALTSKIFNRLFM